MKSGPMRHRVLIKHQDGIEDDYGGYDRSDTDGLTIWASIRPASPREVAQFQQLRQVLTHVIVTRWRDDIKQGQTLVCEGVDYYVTGTSNPDMRKRELQIMARTGGPQ